ncbi:MAG: ABC transporter permease [Phycisphaerales bacterium]
MTRAWAIAQREYASYFRVPTGWVVAAAWLFLCSLIFVFSGLRPGEPATLRFFFSFVLWAMIFVGPAISMRLFSEEHRAGTIEPLMASPASEAGIVVGKFGGSALFFITCLVPTLIFWVILAALARPDPGPMLTGYLGVLLLGCWYISVGLLLSVLTNSQMLAFLGSMFVLGLWEAGTLYGGGYLPAPWGEIVVSLSTTARMADFGKGVIDTGHVVFFLSMTAWFLAISAIVLRARRWR